MQRRDFLKASMAASAALGLGSNRAHATIRAHNWEKYDFGSGPEVRDRLNQGPFPAIFTGCRHPRRRSRHDDDSVGWPGAELWQGPRHLHHGRHGSG